MKFWKTDRNISLSWDSMSSGEREQFLIYRTIGRAINATGFFLVALVVSIMLLYPSCMAGDIQKESTVHYSQQKAFAVCVSKCSHHSNKEEECPGVCAEAVEKALPLHCRELR